MPTADKVLPAKFYKDGKGRVALWQSPNVLLYGWLAFKVISMILSESRFKTGFEKLSMAALFTWAYLEITSGVNYFRRSLGAIVMIMLVFGYFK